MGMNTDDQPLIQDVSDTAFWVAYYRVLETERADALFKDPLAKVLIDDRAKRIAESMPQSAGYTRLNVIMRTVIIDRFLEEAVTQGIDTIINLGAGLDTRPYRMKLPETLRWVEVDYPHILNYKEKQLAAEKPKCRLERIPLDLSDRTQRQTLFSKLASETSNALVMTEGVLPYLTQEQVSSLAEDLHAQKSFKHWIADYISPLVYRFIRDDPKRAKRMQNAPFQFYPDDWLGFFESRAWKPATIHYIPEEAVKHGRKLPMPWWMPFLAPFMNKKRAAGFLKSSGYMLMNRIDSP
jgi:methyltransferase (TIGR00027 family)